MITKFPPLVKYVPPLLLLTLGFVFKQGLLVELAVNWILLLLIEKKGIGVLRLMPTQKTIIQLLAGFALAALFCAAYYGLQTYFSGSAWSVNKSFTTTKFLSASWWTMQSVLYEELIFRAALLYIAIKRIGQKRAVILSAVCFGAYHWFSMGAFGNFVFMAYLLIGTGIMGYIFALAYAKTRALYLAVGLHFGWNLVNNVVFSSGPAGKQLLILKRGETFNLAENVIVLLVQFIVFPLAAYCYIRMLGKNNLADAKRESVFNN